MGILGAIWGFFGVVGLIGFAVFRLAPRGIEALGFELTPLQWAFLIVWSIFMLVAEGYRGFQKKFAPRTAARVKHLRDHPKPLRVIFAPVFCMGFFYAKKKTQITAFCLTLGIIVLVMLVSLLHQPWRGLIDIGVVLGLTYGILSFAVYTTKALFAPSFEHSPEVPE